MDLSDKLAKCGKYKSISKATIRRIVKSLEKKGYGQRTIEKEAKKMLYKNNLAFFKRISFSRMLEDFKKDSSIATSIKWLKRYDPNRLLSLEGLYDEIFKATGRPKKIIDLGCGLNPLTIPWMKLQKGAEYICYDINKELIRFLNEYFRIIRKPYKAYVRDIAIRCPKTKADVAFVFKVSTCLDWQGEDIKKMLKCLKSKYVIISLAIRSRKDEDKARNYFKKLGVAPIKEIAKDKEFFAVIRIE